MRITSVYIAVVAASLHASGSAVITATNVGASVFDNKAPAAIAPSLRTSEGRSLRTTEKRGWSDLGEERMGKELPSDNSFSEKLGRFIRALLCMGPGNKGPSLKRAKSSGHSVLGHDT